MKIKLRRDEAQGCLQIFFGVGFVLLGLVLGIYVGFWLCFIGGIVDVINQIRAPNMDAYVIALGIAKFMFASFLGAVSGLIPMSIGQAILSDGK